MIILVVAYGAGSSGACLMKDNSVVSCKMENEASLYFPRETAEEVLSESGVDISEVDYIVFPGKPILYFERIINSHIRHFPGHFLKFFLDAKDLLGNTLRIKAIVKKNLDFRKDICYIELTDAIARQISKEYPSQDMTIMVFLRDCLSSRVGGCYQKKGEGLFLNQELCSVNPVNNERSSEVMRDELRKLLSFEKKPSDDKIILASNCLFPSGFEESLSGGTGNLHLRALNDSELLEYAGRYAFEGIDKW